MSSSTSLDISVVALIDLATLSANSSIGNNSVNSAILSCCVLSFRWSIFSFKSSLSFIISSNSFSNALYLSLNNLFSWLRSLISLINFGKLLPNSSALFCISLYLAAETTFTPFSFCSFCSSSICSTFRLNCLFCVNNLSTNNLTFLKASNKILFLS